MNRRQVALAMAAAPLAATSLRAQGGGAGNVSTNLRAFVSTVVGATSVSGTFDIRRFENINGTLNVIGTISLTNGVSTAVTTLAVPVLDISTTPQMAIAQQQASCPILHLELGPLDLNLLGLVIHLDRIVLDITAQPGPGNLLGNLLCAVANLLNQGGALQNLLNQLVALLNQILGAL